MGTFGPAEAIAALKMGVGFVQNRQQAKAANRAAAAQAAAETDRIRRQQKIASDERRKKLRRVLAQQRARFGAAGISGDGSRSAVLGGLASEADQDIANARAEAEDRINHINRDLQISKRRNLLAASRPVQRWAFQQFTKILDRPPLLR